MMRLSGSVLALLLLLPALAAGQSVVTTGTITTSSGSVTAQALNKGNGTIQVTGTWSATLRLQCKIGTGSLVTVNLIPIAGGAAVTSFTANGTWLFTGGFDYCEVNASAFTSGTATINILVTNAHVPPTLATLSGSGASLRFYGAETVFTELLENSSGAFLINMSTIKPAAPTVALAGAGAGNVDNGTHVYCVTFITATGETECSASSSAVTVVDKTVNGKVTVTFTVSTFLGVTGRNVYRSAANTTTPLFLVATSPVVNNNTATTYTDNIADASLTATQSSSANTTDDLRASLSNNGAWTWRALAAPGTPASGFGVVYIDSTSKNLAVKNDAGAVNHGIQSVSGAIADDGSITSTGTGGFVRDTSPTLVTPVLGVATGTSFQGIIGNVTPAAGTFTTLAVNTSESGAGTFALTGNWSRSGTFTFNPGVTLVADDNLGVASGGAIKFSAVQNTTLTFSNNAGAHNPGAGSSNYALFDSTSGNVSNNNGAKTWVNLQLNPTINHGGSNLNSTEAILAIAPVLTSLTGSTLALLDVGFTTSTYASGFTSYLKVTSAGKVLATDLKTTGAATGKNVVCVDTATGQLYASSTGTDCSN